LRPRRLASRDVGALRGAGALSALYLASLLVVDLSGAQPHDATQTSQLALSAFWAVLGFGSLVAGLAREVKLLRLAGLGLLALAVGKVFIVDLAALESIWRVASFLALGLLLLGFVLFRWTAPHLLLPLAIVVALGSQAYWIGCLNRIRRSRAAGMP